MRRLPSLLVNLILAVLVLGAAGWSMVLVRGGLPTTVSAASAARTVTVAQGTVTATVSADGAVEAASTATAVFGTAGTVTGVFVKVGQQVTAGQLLAKVDEAAAQRALALARANQDAAAAALSRVENAHADRTAAANAVATAKLAVENAQAAVAGTQLVAPMTGTVITVNGTVGTPVANTEPGSGASSTGTGRGFVEVADLAALQVTAHFAEADATRLQVGQDATITWSALPGAQANGKVLAVDPIAATTTGDLVSYGASISLATLPTGAKPGQSVSVTVTTGSATNVTYVNSAAVKTFAGGYTVTVRKGDGTTESRAVRVGLVGDDAYEVTSGLTIGEQVLLPTDNSGAATANDSRQRGPIGGTEVGAGGLSTGRNGGPP